MATGLSLHVGINQPDPAFGMNMLHGCLNDAEAMFELASANGFWARKLIDEQATFENVSQTISWAASVLQRGDIFLFTFAGHGSVTAKETIEADDDGLQDQTILLFDCVLVDNYIRRVLWTQFNPGVRILGIADSCHSGTALTAFNISPLTNNPVFADVLNTGPGSMGIDAPANAGGGGVVTLDAPPDVEPVVALSSVPLAPDVRGFTLDQQRDIENARPEIHQRIRNLVGAADKPLNAVVLSLAACMDNETALDRPAHGAFTQSLLDVWDDGAFGGNYEAFIDQISTRLNSTSQHPNLRPLTPDETFLNQRPFTILAQ